MIRVADRAGTSGSIGHSARCGAVLLEQAVKRTLTLLVIIGATVGLSVRALAHHRYAEVYVESREITIEGDVVQWDYRNPHSFVHVVARNGRNQPERWIVECRAAVHLRQRGVTEATFRPGQRVIITGSPGRVSTDRRLRLRAIVRPQDGWRWRDVN